MKTLIPTPIFFFLILFCFLTVSYGQDINKEIKRTKEKDVKLSIESSFGSMKLEKGDPEKILSVTYVKKEDHNPKLNVRYDIKNTTGELDVELQPENAEISEHGTKVHVNNFNFKTDQWYVKLSGALPYDIQAELGAGKSNFDLSGIQVRNLSISSGASSTQVQFDEPNKFELESFTVETGVSKFTGQKLGNANFRKMKFEGGVGSYYLNFDGELKHEADVSIEVGLGSVTIVIPRNIGATIKYKDNWFSNISFDDEEFIRQRKGVYKTSNYTDAEGKLNISLEANLGSVKIRRSK